MAGVTILDGGMGQELLKRSGDVPTPLWATQVMLNHPGLVADIHSDYFDAGAEIATANTYAIHRDRLAPVGLEGDFEKYIDLAMSEAEAARDRRGGGLIAGSLGPLVASYRPDIFPAHEQAVESYTELASLISPRSDLLIAETVASLAHAEAVLQVMAEQDRPAWLAVTVDDEDGGLLRSGEPVAELGPLVVRFGPDAVLGNCSSPEAMEPALREMAGFGCSFGAYANGFQEITKAFLQARPTADTLSARKELTPLLYADFAELWVSLGATIVGGCCEVGPAHIRELTKRFGGAQ